MSEPQNRPLAAELVIRHALAVLLAGKSPKKVERELRRIEAAAYALECEATGDEKVFPIRGGGVPLGRRPSDLEKLEAARLLDHYATQARTAFGGRQ